VKLGDVSLGVETGTLELRLRVLELLVEVLGRLGLHKLCFVEQGRVASLVVSQRLVLVPGGEVQVLNVVLLHELEEGLVAAQLEGLELVVVPVLVVHILHVDLGLAHVGEFVDVGVGAALADVDAEPDEGVAGVLLLAVDTVLVVGILGDLLLEELLDLLRLGNAARLEEFNVGGFIGLARLLGNEDLFSDVP